MWALTILDLIILETGLEITGTRGNWVDAICPLHPERRPSFAMRSDTGVWVCRHEGFRGGPAKLIAMVKNIPYSEAQGMVAELDNRIATTDELVSQLFPKDEPGIDSDLLGWRERYDGLKPGLIPKYWMNRGFAPETAMSFGLRYDPNERALVWPVYGSDGDLSGMAQRYVYPEAQPKYRYNKGFVRELYPLTHWQGPDVLLVEGPLDAMWLHQCGEKWPFLKAALCLFGAQLAPAQIDWLRANAREVLLFFDGDKAGAAAIDRAIELMPDMNLWVGLMPMKPEAEYDDHDLALIEDGIFPRRKDPQECTADELADSVAQAVRSYEFVR